MRDEEATAVLSVNDGFLPPVIKGKDGHFLNAIHTLEYFDSFKTPLCVDRCPCPSFPPPCHKAVAFLLIILFFI